VRKLPVLKCASLGMFWAAQLAFGAPVLLISIDGLRPDAVTQADAHGLRVPNLRKFVREGSWAEGVTGVVPTVTYPSHTTILTGVSPAEHGILANTTFDPLQKNQVGWYWYATDVRVPTLWDAADRAGIVTASLNWPVSVAAKGVRFLIPEYWRAETPDDMKLLTALSRPEEWMNALEAKLGPYTNGNDTTVTGDELRTKYALEILETQKPGFMTIHLSALDEVEHETAPFSAQSNQTLEALDGMIGRLAGAALKNDPNAAIAVVSDHGFARTDYRLNIAIPFIQEGFIKTGKTGLRGPTVDSWTAEPWPAGGMAAIMLRDPKDTACKRRVEHMLRKLASDPRNGIARVLAAGAPEWKGGFPDAAFLLELKLGYQLGYAFSGPLVTPAPSTGMHGYLPDRPEMRASFFVMGGGIAQGKALGVIDMRQIAPTLASILGVEFPSATQPMLDVAARKTPQTQTASAGY